MSDLISNGKVVILPDHGRVLVGTDFHGNFDDFQLLYSVFERALASEDIYLVLAGDYIHSLDQDDGSRKILGTLIEAKARYGERVIPLLGNHEYSHISGEDVVKGWTNQTQEFEADLPPEELRKYVEFFKTLPLLAKTRNGVSVSHSGPVGMLQSLDELANADCSDLGNPIVEAILWNRHYSQSDSERFLKALSSDGIVVNVSVFGHNPIREGWRSYGQNMLVLSTSFGARQENKTYLDIPLDGPSINSVQEIKKILLRPASI